MARLIHTDATGPLKIQCGDDNKWLCRCGLSKKQPWCDSSHKRTLDEEPGKLYVYEGDSRREITPP